MNLNKCIHCGAIRDEHPHKLCNEYGLNLEELLDLYVDIGRGDPDVGNLEEMRDVYDNALKQLTPTMKVKLAEMIFNYQLPRIIPEINNLDQYVITCSKEQFERLENASMSFHQLEHIVPIWKKGSETATDKDMRNYSYNVYVLLNTLLNGPWVISSG